MYLFYGDRICPSSTLTESNLEDLRANQIINDLLRPIKSILTATDIEFRGNVHVYSKGYNEMLQSYPKL